MKHIIDISQMTLIMMCTLLYASHTTAATMSTDNGANYIGMDICNMITDLNAAYTTSNKGHMQRCDELICILDKCAYVSIPYIIDYYAGTDTNKICDTRGIFILYRILLKHGDIATSYISVARFNNNCNIVQLRHDISDIIISLKKYQDLQYYSDKIQYIENIIKYMVIPSANTFNNNHDYILSRYEAIKGSVILGKIGRDAIPQLLEASISCIASSIPEISLWGCMAMDALKDIGEPVISYIKEEQVSSYKKQYINNIRDVIIKHISCMK